MRFESVRGGLNQLSQDFFTSKKILPLRALALLAMGDILP